MLYLIFSYSFEGYEFFFDFMCDFIKNEFGINIKFRSEKFDIKKVCKLVLECFWVINKVYIFWIN